MFFPFISEDTILMRWDDALETQYSESMRRGCNIGNYIVCEQS